MKKSVLLCLCLLFSSWINAQYTQNIRGTVCDKDTRQPLLGVNIILLSSSPQMGTTSDEDGRFILPNVPVGRHELQISYLGYKPSSLSVLLGSTHEVVLDIELIQMVYEADEVVITSTQKDRPLNSMAQVSARSFTVEETERYAGTWGDPARMAANFAGVMSSSEARNDIVIRGNSPLGLLWQLEGINVPNPNHFGALGTTGGPISMLNNNLLRNSDFYTGAFPAEYGNALSGVFDLNMRNGNNQTREHLVQIGLNGFELGTEGPFSKSSKASYLINYRYSFLGLLEKFGVDYGPEGTVPEYQDLSYKILVPTTKAGTFSLFGIAGNSAVSTFDSKLQDGEDFTYADFGVDYTYESGMMTVGAGHDITVSEKSRLTTRFAVAGSFSNYYYDSISIVDTNLHPYTRSNLTEWQYSLSTVFSSKLNTRNQIRMGVKADIYQPEFIDSTRQYDGRFVIGSRADGSMTVYQAFAELKHRFTDQLSAYVGLHGQLFSLNSNSSLEPRASLKWNFLTRHSISLGYGLHSQLQPHQIYFTETYHRSTDSYIKSGNKDLEFTKSQHLVLGYDFLLTRNFRIKLETYYQDIYNVPVESNPSYVSMLNHGAAFYIPEYDSLVNEGTGRNYGIELTIEKFFADDYYFLITTSLFEAKYTGSDGIERNSAFNNNYVVNALGGYEFQLGENMALTASTKYVISGGNRYVPYTAVQDDNGRYYREYDEDHAFESQYSPYQRWDIMLTLRLNMSRVTNEWIVDFQNLTHNKNLYFNETNPVTGADEPTYHQGFAWMMMWRMRF